MAVSVGLLTSSLSSCSPVYVATISDSKISVPVSLFAKSNLQIIRVQHYGYDIALRKESGENYVALLLRCTHAENPLISKGSDFFCDLHGSNFDKNGKVTKGPAEQPLKKLSTERVSDNIIITVS